MSDAVFLHVPKAAEEPVRRVEVFTGTGRRRRWSADEKARIVAESYRLGDTVCGVARRHGLTHSQLFAWRREARRRIASEHEPPHFVPAIVEASPPEAASPSRRRAARPPRRSARRGCRSGCRPPTSGRRRPCTSGRSSWKARGSTRGAARACSSRRSSRGPGRPSPSPRPRGDTSGTGRRCSRTACVRDPRPL